MADLARKGDLDIRIVDASTQDSAQVVTDPATQKALKVYGYVNIEGGSAKFLTVANKFETAVITSATGWNNVLSLTVTALKKWYLKGMIIGSSRSAQWRLVIGGVTKLQGHIDASDSMPIELHGYEVDAGVTVVIQMNCGAANQTFEANMIIYEE